MRLLAQHNRALIAGAAAFAAKVRDKDDTVWYFMANVEHDLAALAKQLNSTVEVGLN